MAEFRIKIQFRNDTAANWMAVNPILDMAEPGIENDTGKFKTGDGVTAWDSLPYAVGGDGPPGADGAMGPAGPQGDDGPQGVAGNDGAQGPQGPQGIPGADGNDGAAGPQGVPGNDGATGPAGADGAVGPQGPQGPQGVPGADGAQGPQGLPGADGATGPQGLTGPQGPPGADGVGGGVTSYASFHLTTGGLTGLAATASTLVLNATELNTGEYTLAGNEVTIAAAGDYEIHATCYLNNSSNTRTEYTIWLEVDGVEVPGTRSGIYARGYDSGSTGVICKIMTIGAGQVARLRITRTDGTGSTGYQDDNGTSLTIKKLGG